MDHRRFRRVPGTAVGGHIAVIERGLLAFQIRDLEAWLACFDPEVRVFEDPSIPDAGRYEGHDGLLRWMRVMDRNWDSFRVEGEHFIDHGEDVVVLHRVRGTGRLSGAEIEGRFGSVFSFRARRVVCWTIYAGWAEALSAVGIAF
jgi:ketosteroid isomerase-like protein